MRLLIDGYNVMYALGLMEKRLGPERFRKVRRRFLNLLVDGLGPVDAHQTTVVFDAAAAPAELPSTLTHKGITVIFAVDDESADARIEQLIAKHSTPKSLTVVSSDQRLRQAATRRKARALTAEEFWNELEARKSPVRTEPSAPAEPSRDRKLTAQEAAYWLAQFSDLDDLPETGQALNRDPGMLTDEEIADLEREIDREFET